MRLALAQINTVVGDLDGNRDRILAALAEARGAHADLVLLPELAITGYPPEDLLLRPGFLRAARAAVKDVAAACTELTALVGVPWFDRDLANACAVCDRRRAARPLPQAVPAQLRRLRRAPLLRIRPRPRPPPHRRDADRADDLRGRLAARATRHRPRARGRAADRQHLRVAVPRRQGRGPRGDARHPRAGQQLLPRLLQRRRRAGRADLRRPFGGARRRGPGDRAGARLRGGAARSSTSSRRRRSDGGCATCGGASSRSSATCRTSPSSTSARTAGRPRSSRATVARFEHPSSSRCAARSCSGSATT